jgi:parvulin-like peptidyl-prolyl isomerase
MPVPHSFNFEVTMPGEESNKVITKKHLARLEREKIQRRYLITGITVALILVVGVIVYGLLDQYVFQGQKAVAMVANEKITTGEYQGRVRYARWQLIERFNRTQELAQMFGGISGDNGNYFKSSLEQIQSQLNDTEGLGKSVLEALIDEKVIEQEAAAQGITVDEKEIDAAIQEAFGFFANGTPTPAATLVVAPTSTLSAEQLAIVTITPTPTQAPTATEMPTATPSGVEATPTQETTPLPTPTAYTVEGFNKQYQDYVKGMTSVSFTDAEFRKAFKLSLLRVKLAKIMTADTNASEEQVWARHILVSEEQEAKDIIARLQKGESWDALASELSKDTSNKDSGGDLGWFGKAKMVQEFADAAFALKIGEISQPVKSSFGYHIIQVLGHEERPLDEATFAEKKQTVFTDWLTKARTEKNVQTFDVSKITPKEPVLAPIAAQ